MEILQKIDFSHFSLEQIFETLLRMSAQFMFRLFVAAVVFFVGRWLINRLNTFVRKLLDKKNTDPSINSFLKSVINITLTIVLIIAVVSILGIETTSMVALFASAGVAFGMAMSGTLQNFAGGFMILLFKPYRVGDVIDAQGQSGTVKEIQIFNTVMETPDNKLVFIPNGKLSTDVIVNYSRQKNRRVELIVNISYGVDYDHAKAVIIDILEKEKRVLKNPEYVVAVQKLNDSSVDIVVRAWVARANYSDVNFALNEAVYKAFMEKGIEIPFPQLTVHLAKD